MTSRPVGVTSSDLAQTTHEMLLDGHWSISVAVIVFIEAGRTDAAKWNDVRSLNSSQVEQRIGTFCQLNVLIRVTAT